MFGYASAIWHLAWIMKVSVTLPMSQRQLKFQGNTGRPLHMDLKKIFAE
jgi:hypothetical protein